MANIPHDDRLALGPITPYFVLHRRKPFTYAKASSHDLHEVLCHEAGHIVAALMVGAVVNAAHVNPHKLNGWVNISTDHLPHSVEAEKLIAMCGPVAQWRARGKKGGIVAGGLDWLSLTDDGWDDDQIRSIIPKAKVLTSERWDAIIEIAERLRREPVVNGDDIHREFGSIYLDV